MVVGPLGAAGAPRCPGQGWKPDNGEDFPSGWCHHASRPARTQGALDRKQGSQRLGVCPPPTLLEPRSAALPSPVTWLARWDLRGRTGVALGQLAALSRALALWP